MKWMLNFDSAFFGTKDIRISSKTNNSSALKKQLQQSPHNLSRDAI